MQTGISYVLNRNVKQAEKDLKEIARFCNFVVHTFSETDLWYHKNIVKEIVNSSHKNGLAVYLDPWGVGGVFGGETFSRFVAENPSACLKKGNHILPVADIGSRKFRRFMRCWLESALAMKPEVIFWDEPHQYSMRYTKIDRKKILSFLQEMTAVVSAAKVKNAICVYPDIDRCAQDFWREVAQMENIDIFATDPYWLLRNKPVDFVAEFSKKVYNLCREYGKEPQIWIQAFKIPMGREREISQAVELAREAGIRNIAAWSFDAGSLIDELNSDNPKLVERTIKKAYLKIARENC